MSDSLEIDMIVRTLEENEWVVTFGRIKWLGMEEAYPHDLTGEPGYVYPIGIQWVDGEFRCIWPYDFMGVTHEGTKKAEIAPWAVEYWKGKL
jgi:branched-chain amino acid transport system substrate-binding protein